MHRLAISLVAGAITLALAGPAIAVKPIRGCPNDLFASMTYQEFRDLSLSVGVPEELLGEEHAAAWDVYDRNDDGLLCVQDLPDNPGTLGGWVFNAIDNTANR